MINKRDLLVTEDQMYDIYPQEKLGRAKDITNLQVGELEVLYKTTSEKIGKLTKPMWVCKCHRCGNIVKRRGDYLYQNRIQSCGCPNYIDITNQKFGKLTALKIHHYNANNGYIWECQCDCDNIAYVSYCHLHKGYSKSCGCERLKQLALSASFGSKGERKIKDILINNNIVFEQEKTFANLQDKRLLPYDFYLPEYNCLIEYDGQQHFQYQGTGWDTKEQFEETQKHDKMKNNYAINNNIILIRIPYTKYDTLAIGDLLPKTSNFIINKDISIQEGKCD